jgi:hypothetical protein
MRTVKILAFITLIVISFSFMTASTAAAKTVLPNPHPGGGGSHGGSHGGYHGGHHGGYYGGYHGGYYGGYHGYYGYPYYYGWPYWGGVYPYFGFGFGYGYGYPSYAYPYSYGYGYGYEPYGEVQTEVKPQDAQLFIDGGFVGKADDYDGWWQRLQLSPGMHRLVFRAPGFQPYVADVRIGPGTDVHLKYEMHPGNDTIAENEMVLPRSEQQQYSRRQYDPYRGNRPQYNPYERPDGRDQQYERRPPQPQDNDGYNNPNNDGYNNPNNDGYNNPNQDDSYYGNQQNQRSDRPELILNVEPDDATVYIDGNYYGTANENGRGELRVLLPEGVHKIEVVRPGFDTFSQDVTVGRDHDNRLSVTLNRR